MPDRKNHELSRPDNTSKNVESVDDTDANSMTKSQSDSEEIDSNPLDSEPEDLASFLRFVSRRESHSYSGNLVFLPPQLMKEYEELKPGMVDEMWDETKKGLEEQRLENARRHQLNIERSRRSDIVLRQNFYLPIILTILVMSGVIIALFLDFPYVATAMGSLTLVVIAIVAITRKVDGVAGVVKALKGLGLGNEDEPKESE